MSTREHVLHLVSMFSKVPVKKLNDAQKLKEDLKMTHIDLVFLTRAIRAFIQSRNPNANIQVPEVEKKNLTIGNLVTLVEERAGV